MDIEKAKQLLPKLEYLVGWVSDYYKSTIEYIFISLKDPKLAKAQYTLLRRNNGLPAHPTDVGNYTISAGLKNGQVVSLKSLIIFDKIEALHQYEDELEELHPDL